MTQKIKSHWKEAAVGLIALLGVSCAGGDNSVKPEPESPSLTPTHPIFIPNDTKTKKVLARAFASSAIPDALVHASCFQIAQQGKSVTRDQMEVLAANIVRFRDTIIDDVGNKTEDLLKWGQAAAVILKHKDDQLAELSEGGKKIMKVCLSMVGLRVGSPDLR